MIANVSHMIYCYIHGRGTTWDILLNLYLYYIWNITKFVLYLDSGTAIDFSYSMSKLELITLVSHRAGQVLNKGGASSHLLTYIWMGMDEIYEGAMGGGASKKNPNDWVICKASHMSWDPGQITWDWCDMTVTTNSCGQASYTQTFWFSFYAIVL